MPAGKKQTFVARTAEYVDSPLLTNRLRAGETLHARINGTVGKYATSVDRTGKIEGNCSCPSEIWPCKHVHALRKTWKVNPASFFDLDTFMRQMSGQSKEELLEAIRTMITEAPEFLAMFGVEGFEDADEEEDEWYD